MSGMATMPRKGPKAALGMPGCDFKAPLAPLPVPHKDRERMVPHRAGREVVKPDLS